MQHNNDVIVLNEDKQKQLKFLLHLYNQSCIQYDILGNKAKDKSRNPMIKRLDILSHALTVTVTEIIDIVVSMRSKASQAPASLSSGTFFMSNPGANFPVTSLLFHALADELVKIFSGYEMWRLTVERMKGKAASVWEDYAALMLESKNREPAIKQTLGMLSVLHKKLFAIGIPGLDLLMGYSSAMELEFEKLHNDKEGMKQVTRDYQRLNSNEITCEGFYRKQLENIYKMSFAQFKAELPCLERMKVKSENDTRSSFDSSKSLI